MVLSGAERDALFAAVVRRRPRSGGIKKARSARSRWSSYYRRSVNGLSGTDRLPVALPRAAAPAGAPVCEAGGVMAWGQGRRRGGARARRALMSTTRHSRGRLEVQQRPGDPRAY